MEHVSCSLKSHPRFIDEIVLIADHDKDEVLAMSFWKSKADAEDFQKKHFRHISEMIEHLTHATPKVHIYDVETSTVHHIANGKAVVADAYPGFHRIRARIKNRDRL